MSMEEDSSSLPNSSSDLCFDGNAFIQPYFSADRFLQEHRGKASLETMRDDLGSYLKVLRSATLDLIDHDYADFVGLSSSLVGLDKAVGKIRDPLGQLREEVMTVKSNLEETVRGIKLQLEVRGTLRVKRSKLEASLQALRSLQLLESLLEEEMQDWQSMDEISQKLPVAERSGAEYNHLRFCLERCDTVDQLKLRASSTHNQLMELLKGMLLTLIHDCEDEDGHPPLHPAMKHLTLARLLRAYASLNEMRVAEELVGEQIVAPALDAVIKAPKDSGRSGSLSEMYNQVLGVVDQKLGILLNLTSNEAWGLHVEGFDFLANGFWPQFVNKLELNLPNMCAPGNPGIFHQRFTETVLFLERLEKFSGGSEAAVKRLRLMPSYQHFLSSWNLPVYFQIRFQELAGSLESTFPVQPYPSHGFDGSNCGSLLGLSTHCPTNGGFWLIQTSACWSCIERCWDSNTFIAQIGHKFWKMSLQFVARYTQWCRDILEHQVQVVKAEDKKPTVAMSSGEIADEPVIEQAVDGGGGMLPGASGGSRAMPGPLMLPLCLHRDVCQLSVQLQHRLLPMAASALCGGTRDADKQQAIGDLLQRSLGDGLRALSDLDPLASRCIVEIISQGSLPHLRQCRDIPRLYRRTNRSHPNRPRPYVSSTLSPALNFRSLVLASLSSPPGEEGSSCTPWVNSALLNHWMQQIFSEITVQYHSGVLEVLTSVHKMEESLRRLKRIRGGGATPVDGEAPSSADDDEKIRAQLVLDVHHFCQQVESTGVQRSQVNQLLELVELVDNAITKVITRPQ